MLSRIIHSIPLDGVVADSLVFVTLHAMVLVAIIVDLASGWHKAKRLGQARTSRALKRTVSKINSYYSCLLLLSMVDVVLYMINIWERVGIPELPYFAARCSSSSSSCAACTKIAASTTQRPPTSTRLSYRTKSRQEERR